MKSVPNDAMNNKAKKPYNKPELQVYGDLAVITNTVKTAGGKTADFKVGEFNRTH